MKQLNLTISLPPPSLNVLLRMHWRERGRDCSIGSGMKCGLSC